MRWPWLLACALPAACADPAPAPREAARAFALRGAGQAGIAAADLPALEHVAELHVDGGTIERFAQVIDGLPVYHHELRMLVRADGSLVASTGTLFSAKTRRSTPHFALDEAAAIRRAVMHTYGIRTVSVGASRARQVWIPRCDELDAAWVVEAYTSDPRSTSGDLRRTVIAPDGHVISDESLVADATYNYRVFAETSGEKHPFDGPIADVTPNPTGVPGGSYPPFVAPNLVTVVDGLNGPLDPWLTADSPDSAGNNVDAYADLAAPNGLGAGDFRAAASGNTFDYVYDTQQGPLVSQTQQMASITSLFYVLNWLHDFWYDAGFDEPAGNAQLSNYGRGGADNDVLLAEAQDNAPGGSRNNANMSTPDDGMSPRMQVYLWSGKDTRTMTLSPSGRNTRDRWRGLRAEGLHGHRRDHRGDRRRYREHDRWLHRAHQPGDGKDRDRRSRKLHVQDEDVQRSERRRHRGDHREQPACDRTERPRRRLEPAGHADDPVGRDHPDRGRGDPPGPARRPGQRDDHSPGRPRARRRARLDLDRARVRPLPPPPARVLRQLHVPRALRGLGRFHRAHAARAPR
jgi:hypothetical protein